MEKLATEYTELFGTTRSFMTDRIENEGNWGTVTALVRPPLNDRRQESDHLLYDLIEKGRPQILTTSLLRPTLYYGRQESHPSTYSKIL